MTTRIGWFTIFVLAGFPLLLWVLMKPLTTRFADGYMVFLSLGQLAGLAGMSLFAISLILSARLSFLESFFGGMNRIYIAHHICGGTAFILLLLHPLLLSATYATTSLKAAALFLLPGADWTINFGIAGLLLLISLLILTYFVRLPYELWRFTHKFLGAAFFLGGVHSFFIPSDIANNIILRNYMILLCFSALALYTYHTLLGRFLIPKLTYIVQDVRLVNKSIIEITLLPLKERLKYQPGQFIFISFGSPGSKTEVHPFSLTSSPSENKLTLTIKSLGDFTKKLLDVPPGTIAKIEGPYGRFSYSRYKNYNQIWIAGGIGITPFVSMARSLKDRRYHIDLYYTVGDAKEAVYLNNLAELSQKFPNLRVFTNFSKKQGRFSVDVIVKTSGPIQNKDIFVCGPPPMMMSMRKQLKKLGVPTDHIHSEEFALQ